MHNTWNFLLKLLTNALKKKMSLQVLTKNKIKRICFHLPLNYKESSFFFRTLMPKWYKRSPEIKTNLMKYPKIYPKNSILPPLSSILKGKDSRAGTSASSNKTSLKVAKLLSKKTSRIMQKNSCFFMLKKTIPNNPVLKLFLAFGKAFILSGKTSKKTKNLLTWFTANFQKSLKKRLGTCSNQITCTQKTIHLCTATKTLQGLNRQRSSLTFSVDRNWFWMINLTDSSMLKRS